ncbi:MAG: Hsp70 family protein [Gemmatimonadetes bacterium]|nr:Hsp70 family protein [Gemmatimonadota bacterium]
MGDRIIGIDLGTTNSVPAAIREGAPTLLPVQGDGLFPSVVGISPKGELLTGVAARNQWVLAPERTIRSIKRRMGSGERVSMAGQEYTPQEISAFILKEIKGCAEAALGEPVRRAVITVPAYFDEVQRQATMEAGEIAGLVVERIVNEPTAAALAYGYGRDDDEHLRVMVYDLGGGTFDVSIIELSHGIIDVQATSGDNHLGGDDFDERIATLLAEEFLDEHDMDLRENHQAWARLLRAAEEAKIRLSESRVVTIDLDYLAVQNDGTPIHVQRELERGEFEDLIADLLDGTRAKIRQALEDADLAAEAIDRVLLVGGSTRIPCVWDLVADVMGQEPHSEIDPDAAVALGAAVQGAIVAGEDVSTILVDVTPLSLGIETARIGWGGRLTDDHFSPLVRRNTTIPVQKSDRFSALHPDQDMIHLKVYQGESPVASENTLLGDFRIEGLEPQRAGEVAEVLVHFALDVNGILDVTVTDEATRRQTHAQLKATRKRMSPEDIARSQGRLAAARATEADAAVALDPGAAALVERARRALEQPGIPRDGASELRDAMARIRMATVDDDPAELEQWCDRLIDLLFDWDG